MLDGRAEVREVPARDRWRIWGWEWEEAGRDCHSKRLEK